MQSNLRTYTVQCEMCGKECTRYNNRVRAICFDCKMKENRRRALEYAEKIRQLKKYVGKKENK